MTGPDSALAAAWLDRLPAALFTPAAVADSSDGYIAHLRRLAESLPPDDPRSGICAEGARVHAEASLPYVTDADG
jgi:hypothetical protein